MKKNLLLATVLILVAVISRLIAHEWNFTAMGAVALVAGLMISNRMLALLVPMVALLISDAVIGFHNIMIAVYLGYILMTVAGVYFAKSKVVFTTALIGSLIFFAISNLGVWLEGALYPMTFSGLVTCYQMAIPFFRNELISNVLLTPVLFYGLNYLAAKSSTVVDVA